MTNASDLAALRGALSNTLRDRVTEGAQPQPGHSDLIIIAQKGDRDAFFRCGSLGRKMLAPSTIISARFHGRNQRESVQSEAGWGQGAGESVPGAEPGLEAVTCVRADTERDTTRAANQFRTPAEWRDGRYLASAVRSFQSWPFAALN